MDIRFWGTRGSIPSPGRETARFGGNTSCVEVLAGDGTHIILDCGTGARPLGQALLQSSRGARRLHLFIGHIHWDHIQGFPFFAPAFLPDTELHVYAPHGFQRTLEDALAGQMQHAYFPLKLDELQSRIRFTRLEEGFFRLGSVLIETQHLNHTAPTIAYRITADGATLVYSTDHEPFWQPGGLDLRHPGDQRHVGFLEGADLVIHDAQYSEAEYPAKVGWGHSTIEYATDVAAAAGARRLALFHHDPTRDDAQVEIFQQRAQARADAQGAALDVVAAAEGLTLALQGAGATRRLARVAATVHRPIAGRSVLVIGADEKEWTAIEQQLTEDNLLVTRAADLSHALARGTQNPPDLVIISQTGESGLDIASTVRAGFARPSLPVLVLTDALGLSGELDGADRSVTDLLTRPFSPPMLRSRVRAWLSRAAEPAVASGRGRRPHNASPRLATREEISRVLGSVALFQSLHPDELDLLSARATERSFRPGEVLIREGARSDELFVILSGMAQVLQTPDGSSQQQRVLGELGPNEVVGEMAILTGMPRSATVIARDPLRCLEISAAEFLRLVETEPSLAGPLAKTLARRIYETDRRIERFAPDPLTGLLGRAAFEEQYARLAALARRRHLRVLLVLLDIADLKGINDQFGYEVGDEVLRTVARALPETVRQTDLVARYSGDEFVMLLVDTGPECVDLVLQRLQHHVRTFGETRGLRSAIRCAFGIGIGPTPMDTVEPLLQQADEDMQQRAETIVLYAPRGEQDAGLQDRRTTGARSRRANRRRNLA